MTATSAAGSRPSVGRCTSTPYRAAGRDPTRRRSTPSPASWSGSPTALSCCSTGWSPRRPPRCSCRRRADCAWSCSCTCRSVTARRTTRSTTPARGNARSCRPPLPSSRPAHGRGAGCWSSTRCPPTRVHVAEPAVDAADLATPSATGEALLCVAAVTFDKGHDVLLDALATISDLSWQCVCVGSLDRDPAFVEALRRRSVGGGLDDRVHFPGPRTGAALHRSYATADLMVLASRAETYGMVRHRGTGPWSAGSRGRGRRRDGGPRSRRGRDPAGVAGPAGRSRGIRRRAPGLARRRRAERTVAARRPRAARVAPGVVDDRVRDRRCPGRGVAVTVEGTRVSREWLALREPADAAARARDLVEHLRRQRPGDRQLGDPRSRLRHRRDEPLARAAAARAAALGHARPRRQTCWRLPPPSSRARLPTARTVTVETKLSDITRLQPGRSRRREPHHRLGAPGHDDRRTSWPGSSPSVPAQHARCS